MKKSKALHKDGQQAGNLTVLLMIESSFFEKISAYMAENERKTALEAEIDNRAAEVNKIDGDGSKGSPLEENVIVEIDQRLDAIYDKEPLGFEKDPTNSGAKMLV